MVDIDDIKRRPAIPILRYFGFSDEQLDGKGHPCPQCRDGIDRFYAFKDVDSTGKVACRKCLPKGSGDVIGAVAWLLGIEQGEAIQRIADFLAITPTKPKRPAAQYRYFNADGKHLYTVHRKPLDAPPWKSFSQQNANGAWSMEGVERTIYNLPEVLKSDLIFVVEGEQDVETLRAIGLVGTCNAGGAGKWQEQFGRLLDGKRVVVIPDNDKPGREHAAKVMESLTNAAAKAILALPGPEKSDVTDWLEGAGTKARLLELSEQAFVKPETAPEPEPKPEPTEDPPTTRAGKLLVEYMGRINSGTLPQLIQQDFALQGFEVGPGMITIVGAPPGFGKTALAMQMMFDAVRLNPELRAVVANAETSFDVLLRRELTRRTRIKSADIRFGRLTPMDLETLNATSDELIPQLERVSVLNDPCNLMQLMRLKDQEPGLLIPDYLQKFALADKDARQGVNEVMAGLRALAKLGWAVLCLSATKRDGNGKHDSKELSLSSFRESGEIEYNADSAYVMRDNGQVGETTYIRHVTLGHVKNRHGEKVNHELQFHMPRMEFTALPKADDEPAGEAWTGNLNPKPNPFGKRAGAA